MDEPVTDPVAPVHPMVNGGPATEPRPPRQVTGNWLVQSGLEDKFPTTITKVVARSYTLVTADVMSNDVPMQVHVIACGCCGRPWAVGLYLRGGRQGPNLVNMWTREKRLDIGFAVYGIGTRAGLRNLLPVQR